MRSAGHERDGFCEVAMLREGYVLLNYPIAVAFGNSSVIVWMIVFVRRFYSTRDQVMHAITLETSIVYL